MQVKYDLSRHGYYPVCHFVAKDPVPAWDMLHPISLFLWGCWNVCLNVCLLKGGIRHEWMNGWNLRLGRCLVWLDANVFPRAALWISRTGHTDTITSLVLDKREGKKKGLFLNHFLLSYFFSSSYTFVIHQPTLFPFSPHCFLHTSYSLFCWVFQILYFLLLFFFPLVLPSCHDSLVTMRNDILWRCCIFWPLPLLTLSWEQNVPGVLPDEPLEVLQSWLLPMCVLLGCTPTAWAFCQLFPTWLVFPSFPVQNLLKKLINQTYKSNCF